MIFRLPLFLFLFCASFLKAQHSFFYSINDESGLPSNEVYRIVQDKMGFLWIGCDAGLYRFNGYSFKAYKNQDQNARSISHLSFDSKNRLWCMNFSGQVFRVEGDSLRLIGDHSASKFQNKVSYSSEGGYWIINREELRYIDEDGRERHHLELDERNNSSVCCYDVLEHSGKIWIGTGSKGLMVYDSVSGSNRIVFPFAEKENAFELHGMIQLGDRILIQGYKRDPIPGYTVYVFDPINEKLQENIHLPAEDYGRVHFISTDSLNRIWISTSTGAYCFDQLSSVARPLVHCFPDWKISSVFQDREGIFWFTDLQRGLHVMPEPRVEKYDSRNSALKDDDISLVARISERELIAGTYSGNLFRLDEYGNVHPSPLNSTNGITVKSVAVSDGHILVSRGGLFVINKMSNTVKEFPFFRNARSMVVLGDSLYSVHPEFVHVVSLQDVLEGKITKMSPRLPVGGRSVAVDPVTSEVYFALNNGLFVLKPQGFVEVTFKGSSIRAMALFADSDRIWMGTLHEGVLFIRNGMAERLPFDVSILEDPAIKTIHVCENYVWGCTNLDFFRVSKRDHSVQVYSENWGIHPRDISSITRFGDQVVLGSRKGMVSFPVSLSPTNETPPVIADVKFFINETELEFGKDLFLPYDFRNLKIELTGFSYKSRKDFYYNYRLQGIDSTWKVVRYDDPVLLFTSLPSGKFTLELQAVNDSGIAGEVWRTYIFVAYPFWERWWFYALISMASLSFAFVVFRLRIRHIQRRNEAEKRLISSQLTALKAQMNPHFMYNALNSIQGLIIKQDIKASNLYLSRFSNLMRKVLDSSGRDEISLQEELEVLDLYLSLERLRFGDDFTYSVDVQANIDPYAVVLPPLILQPFVENAIKHGLLHKKGEKELNIRFLIVSHLLVCEIEDNGIGRERSRQIKEKQSEMHASFSTIATDKRMELLTEYTDKNYSIRVSDVPGGGTLVRITFPPN